LAQERGLLGGRLGQHEENQVRGTCGTPRVPNRGVSSFFFFSCCWNEKEREEEQKEREGKNKRERRDPNREGIEREESATAGKDRH